MVSDTLPNTSEAASRYASALFELARDAKALKTVEKDVKLVAGLFKTNGDLRHLALSPVFSSADKASALVAVFKKAGVGALTTQFVGTCAQNGRAAEIPAFIAAFEAKVAADRGASSAKVTSAVKLSADELKSLKASLKASLGKDVDIETDVDPELIGGFVVKVGSRLFDNSLKTKLEGLKLAMKEA